MDKMFLRGLVLFVLVQSVAAAGYMDTLKGAVGGAWSVGTALANAQQYIAQIAAVGATILIGGIAALAILFVLQYLGIDIIGWTLSLITFLFDVFFTIIRWTLASDANLVAMIILFIVFWAIALWGIPSVLLGP